MSFRIISSISDVITNSSTEIFLIQGEDALRQMIGTGIYKKYKKDFIHLKTEEEIMDFILENPGRNMNHNYYSQMIRSFLGTTIYDTFQNCISLFPNKREEIIELFKPIIIKELKDTIIYYNLKDNKRIMNRLESLYPTDYYNVINKNKFRYLWTKD